MRPRLLSTATQRHAYDFTKAEGDNVRTLCGLDLVIQRDEATGDALVTAKYKPLCGTCSEAIKPKIKGLSLLDNKILQMQLKGFCVETLFCWRAGA